VKSLRNKLFSLRSYTPIPFLLVMIIFAQPSALTMAAGFIIAAAGEYMRFWGVAYAGSLTRVTGSVGAPEVIVAGPFARVRNPLYIGNMLTYVGIGVMSNAMSPWLVILAALWFSFQYYQIVLAEEEFLEKESEPYIWNLSAMFRVLFQEYRHMSIRCSQNNCRIGKRLYDPNAGHCRRWVWCCRSCSFFGI
jgi:hypothetical protein